MDLSEDQLSGVKKVRTTGYALDLLPNQTLVDCRCNEHDKLISHKQPGIEFAKSGRRPRRQAEMTGSFQIGKCNSHFL